MVDSSDMRDFRRMSISCKAQLKNMADGSVLYGNAINISATGLLVVCDQELPAGQQYEVNVAPEKQVVPPLDALVEVLRVRPAEEAGKYEVAFVINEMRS
jgi:hypothetical protein